MTTEWVATTEELRRALEPLQAAPRWAMDTEAAGFHRYRDRLCLVQLAAGGRAVLVDALAPLDWTPLAEPLADPAREIILHGADYDLRLLRRDAGLRVRGLFDTQVAAMLLGERELGLQALVGKYLGRTLTKKFQRADWAHRPLPPAMLAYAVEDVAVLEPLRDRLATELRARGRWAWAEEEFRAREEVEPARDGTDPDAYLRLKGAGALAPAALAILRPLYAWRERVAAARDQPPFRVLANGGFYNLLGISPIGRLDWTPVWLKELTIRGIYGYQYESWQGATAPDFEIAIRLMEEGRIDLSHLVTHRFRLDQYHQALDVALNKGKHHAVKVAFVP